MGAPFWKDSKQSTIQGQVLSVIYKDTFLQSGRLYSKRVNKSSVKSLTVHCDEDRRQSQNEVIMLKIGRGKGLYFTINVLDKMEGDRLEKKWGKKIHKID